MPTPRQARRRKLGDKKRQDTEGRAPNVRRGATGPQRPMGDASRGPGLRSLFKPCQHLQGSLWFVAAVDEQRGATYTYWWLSVATLAACGYLWPSTLTMPLNYNEPTS